VRALFPDVRRFRQLINADKVFGTHSHCGCGDGNHSRSSENKFSEFRIHMFPPFLGFFDPIGDRSQSDHGRSLPKFRPRPPGPTSLDGGYLRAGGTKSRGPFLSPRWTLVQRIPKQKRRTGLRTNSNDSARLKPGLRHCVLQDLKRSGT
jgi:hypothetical protein